MQEIVVLCWIDVKLVREVKNKNERTTSSIAGTKMQKNEYIMIMMIKKKETGNGS